MYQGLMGTDGGNRCGKSHWSYRPSPASPRRCVSAVSFLHSGVSVVFWAVNTFQPRRGEARTGQSAAAVALDRSIVHCCACNRVGWDRLCSTDPVCGREREMSGGMIGAGWAGGGGGDGGIGAVVRGARDDSGGSAEARGEWRRHHHLPRPETLVPPGTTLQLLLLPDSDLLRSTPRLSSARLSSKRAFRGRGTSLSSEHRGAFPSLVRGAHQIPTLPRPLTLVYTLPRSALTVFAAAFRGFRERKRSNSADFGPCCSRGR
jgi:hypothetical protein